MFTPVCVSQKKESRTKTAIWINIHALNSGCCKLAIASIMMVSSVIKSCIN